MRFVNFGGASEKRFPLGLSPHHMDHKIITIIKWLFLAIGIGMLLGAIFGSPNASLPLSFLGLVFASVGGGIVGYGWWSAKEASKNNLNT